MDNREMLIDEDARKVADLLKELQLISQKNNWPLMAICFAGHNGSKDSVAILGCTNIDGGLMLELLRGAGPLGRAICEASQILDAGHTVAKSISAFAELVGDQPCECPDCTLERASQSNPESPAT